ncbi:hypothetical protein C2S51_011558 [Perilla frutescens var. frutescens]|nr:hypothetical protein C2S51_011558 [Perilla frutescens var. frutescens]
MYGYAFGRPVLPYIVLSLPILSHAFLKSKLRVEAMKLRVRPFQSKETLKIEVPNSCTLPQFRQILSQTLPNSPFPASIRLSLNRKDDLQSDGPDSLQSLGIAAGDLIYFSVEEPPASAASNSQISLSQVTDSTPIPRSNDSISEFSTSLSPQNTLPEVENSNSVMEADVLEKGETLGTGSQMEADDEDNENDHITDESFEIVDKSFSVPGFLRKVFAAELGDDGGRDHKLIVIAVHAVLLESGFVGYDEKANAVVDGFQLRNEWPSGLFRVSLFYTLPESAMKSVVLKFQSLGKFINVYGTLGNGSAKRGTHRVQLNEDELVPFLNVVWANCGVMENVSGGDGESSSTSPEKEVFKFWRAVKDNLALPLLIDFCEEAGLELPPCFMRLPTELKLKILESLPGVDVAKVSSVCSELRYLASSDDLWKVKFGEEFSKERKEGQVSWKKAFSMAWSRRDGRRPTSRVRASPYWPMPYWPQPRRRRYPNPLIFQRVPRFVGDEYVAPPPHGDDLQTWLHDPMRSFSPLCNLGVRGGIVAEVFALRLPYSKRLFFAYLVALNCLLLCFFAYKMIHSSELTRAALPPSSELQLAPTIPLLSLSHPIVVGLNSFLYLAHIVVGKALPCVAGNSPSSNSDRNSAAEPAKSWKDLRRALEHLTTPLFSARAVRGEDNADEDGSLRVAAQSPEMSSRTPPVPSPTLSLFLSPSPSPERPFPSTFVCYLVAHCSPLAVVKLRRDHARDDADEDVVGDESAQLRRRRAPAASVMAAIAVTLHLHPLSSTLRTLHHYSFINPHIPITATSLQFRRCRTSDSFLPLEKCRNSIHEARAWSANPRRGMVMGDYGDDIDEDDDDDDDDEEEEEDRSLDLLIRFVENVFRKVSRKARRAVKSVLPVPISTRLVGFAVNGTIILTFLWVLKAFLQVICTLGTVVFVSILIIRGIWTGISYLQESRSYRAYDDEPQSWNRSQPAT